MPTQFRFLADRTSTVALTYAMLQCCVCHLGCP